MNSIGIWVKPNGPNKASENVHIDINVWLDKDKTSYIEFGLMVEEPNKIDTIFIYMPYQIRSENFADKVGILRNNPKLTNALFNDTMTIKEDGKFTLIESSTSEKSFFYCILNKIEGESRNIFIDACEDGTILRVLIPTDLPASNKTLYFRFRINKTGDLHRIRNENHFVIDGFFKKIGFLELSINEIRGLPDDISNKVKGGKFKSLHFFLMTTEFITLVDSSQERENARILENHIWDNYLKWNESSKLKMSNKVIAYHWKETAPFLNYTLFAKLSFSSKKLLWIILFILFVTLIGVFSDVIGNYITKNWFKNFESSPATQSINTELIGGKNDPGIYPGKHSLPIKKTP